MLPAWYVMYAASAKNVYATIRSAVRSASSSSSGLPLFRKRQTRAAADVTSIRLSRPNPTRAMLAAIQPAPIATSASLTFQAIVQYSRLSAFRILSF
jgi:hypothetical protein